MRIDTKLNALQKVTQDGQFIIKHEYILNNQRVKIDDWGNVIIALQVLQEVDWIGDDGYRQLLDDYLEHRAEADTLELPSGEFEVLHQAVQRYNPGLEIILNTLRAHSVPNSGNTIWVEIKSATDPAELAEIVKDIERTLDIAGQVDSSFRFVGVAQGSDWLGFMPNSDLTGLALNYCIGLAGAITLELIKASGHVMTAMARRSLRKSGDENPAQEDVDKELRDIKKETRDLMVEEGVQKFTERLAEFGYPKQVQNTATEAMKKATVSIQEMADENRAIFNASESGKNINIYIDGSNNQITFQNPPEMPKHPEALASADSESDGEG